MATEKSLTAEEICRIIESSGKAKVWELKTQGLILRFGPERPSDDVCALPSTPKMAVLETEQKQVEETSHLEEELRTRSQQLEEMLIEDPARFEKMLVDGELDEGAGEAQET